MNNITIKTIEKEMTELYAKKEVAYIDYRDNTGDTELANRLWRLLKEIEKRKKMLAFIREGEKHET